MIARASVVAVMLSACGDDGGTDPPVDASNPPCVSVGFGGGTIPVDGMVTKMIADVRRCRIYGLAGDRLIVINGRTKTTTTAALPSVATDLDLAQDGKLLVVSHPAARSITRLDTATLAVVAQLTTTAAPNAVEVSTYGEAYYVDADARQLYRIDLATGVERALPSQLYSVSDIELSIDDRFLHGGSQSSPAHAVTVGIFDGAHGVVDDSQGGPVETMGNALQPRVVLSPLGERLYYAQLQIDATDLQVVHGALGETILADAGSITIGVEHTWRPARLESPRALATPISAAATLGAEAWLFEPSTMQLRYVTIDELLGG